MLLLPPFQLLYCFSSHGAAKKLELRVRDVAGRAAVPWPLQKGLTCLSLTFRVKREFKGSVESRVSRANP